MNPISTLFKEKKNILSIYFTAGFPNLNSTKSILDALVGSGADMIEIGIPFSDPLADGPVIQHSSEVALKNGMTIQLLFHQLDKLKVKSRKSKVPLILMGYLNPVLQFGMEHFCREARKAGISGVILPDLPMDVYLSEYKPVFEKYKLKNIFLITPQTSEKRIREIDKRSDGFIYMVSSSSTTGAQNGVNKEKEKYFNRIRRMKLKSPVMIGFGISDRTGFSKACKFANGAIIGSAFISHIEKGEPVNKFIKQII